MLFCYNTYTSETLRPLVTEKFEKLHSLKEANHYPCEYKAIANTCYWKDTSRAVAVLKRQWQVTNGDILLLTDQHATHNSKGCKLMSWEN
jgi:hypothetical protein